MSIDANSARALLYRAIAASVADDDRHRARAVAACAIKTAQVAKAITGNAVHLHGGIGIAREYTVGRFLLRALVNERLLCDRRKHLAGDLQSVHEGRMGGGSAGGDGRSPC